MKYQIDTIPVLDAYKLNSECPLCIIVQNSEKSYIESFLGASVMEPDVRVEVNNKGFCINHFSMLYSAQNRLGLALITHTYLKEVLKNYSKKSKDAMHANQINKTLIQSLFRKSSDAESEFIKFLDNQHKTCIICDRIENSLNRYAYTILHLWNTDSEFKSIFSKSKGFCLPHLSTILKIAHETLDNKKLTDWISDCLELETQVLNTLDEELYWFTQKFDYKNKDKPWGNSKDSLPRSIQKLIGRALE